MTAGPFVTYSTICDTSAPGGITPPYCAGVYYARSSDGGTTWDGGGSGADPFPLSPLTMHADRGSIAASGQYVYAVYVTEVGYYTQMCANSPRVLYVRVNDNYGAAGNWGPLIQLTDPSGKVDYPSMSAAGSSVYIIHTDETTGDLVTDVSTDSGATWVSRRIGNTRATYDNHKSPGAPTCVNPPALASLEGLGGMPAIAGNGSQVGASWISSDNGKLVVKISTDNGVTWPGGAGGYPCTGGGTQACTQHMTPGGSNASGSGSGAGKYWWWSASNIAASGTDSSGRVAVVWTNDDGTGNNCGGSPCVIPKGIYVRVWTAAGGWAPMRLVACFTTDPSCGGSSLATTHNAGYYPAISMYGTGGIGIAWAACPIGPKNPCNQKDTGKNQDSGAEIIWKESGDGTTWFNGSSPPGPYRNIAANTASACGTPSTDPCSKMNEWPGIVFDKPGDGVAGCAQSGSSPEAGCVRYVFFVGRAFDYSHYRIYLQTGTQT